jgi:hypothetical protein
VSARNHRALLAAVIAQARAAANPEDQAVLDRLADPDAGAGPLFGELHPDGEGWGALVADCVTAARIEREHAIRLTRVNQRAREGAAAAAGLARAAAFLRPLMDGALIDGHPPSYANPDPLADALATVQAAIAFQRRMAADTLASLSRRGDPAAARSAALGWIAEAVLRLTGAPNRPRVEKLAGIVFGKEVTGKAVRAAVLPSNALRYGHDAP